MQAASAVSSSSGCAVNRPSENPPGDLVLAVGTSSNRFCHAPHQPRNIGQPLSYRIQFLNVVANGVQFEFGGFTRTPINLSALRKQPPPALGDFRIGPLPDDIRSSPDHDVQVIAHDRKPEHIDAKDPGQFFESIPDPLLAMGVILPRASIDTAQMCPPHKSPPDSPVA